MLGAGCLRPSRWLSSFGPAGGVPATTARVGQAVGPRRGRRVGDMLNRAAESHPLSLSGQPRPEQAATSLGGAVGKVLAQYVLKPDHPEPVHQLARPPM